MSVPVRGGRVVVLRHDHYNPGAGGGSVTWKAVDERLFLGIPIRRKTLVDYDSQSLEVKALSDSMVQVSISSSFGSGQIHRIFKVPRD